MGGQLGGAVTASLTPYIAGRYGWNAAFFVAATLALIGACLWLLIDPGQSLNVVRAFSSENRLSQESDREQFRVLSQKP
jgi:dipeptide/tripeptide permease